MTMDDIQASFDRLKADWHPGLSRVALCREIAEAEKLLVALDEEHDGEYSDQLWADLSDLQALMCTQLKQLPSVRPAAQPLRIGTPGREFE